MKMKLILLITCLSFQIVQAQVTFEKGATINIGAGGRIIVKGDLNSFADIIGDGKVLMNGANQQLLNVNGYAVKNIAIDNSSNIKLNSDISVTDSFDFYSGKLILGEFNAFLNEASINGAGPSSYFVTDSIGELYRTVGNVPRIFPVGIDTTSFTPATIANSGTQDVFNVRTAKSVKTNGISGLVFTSGVVNRTWFISEVNTGGSNATIALQWNLFDELTQFNQNQAHLAHYELSTWNLGSVQTVTSNGSIKFLTRTGINSFSPFAVVNSNATVPVSLVDFTGRASNKIVLLSWKTLNEINARNFLIQRSIDATNFETIGSVNATGNSQTENRYLYNDNEPMINNYYRLIVIDKDGARQFSEIVNVRMKEHFFTILKNPVQDELVISRVGSSPANIVLYNSEGRAVKVLSINSPGNIIVSVNNLPSGIYIAKFNVDGTTSSQKFIIVR